MPQVKGQLVEIWSENGAIAGQIACPPSVLPAPGQYLAAYAPEDGAAALTHPLFLAGTAPDGMRVAPPLPSTWQPGTQLDLRGPLGHGFHLPISARHVALAALGDSPARVLSLVDLALAQGCAVTLFCDLSGELPWRNLPDALEVSPLATLKDALAWADYLALDIPIQRLSERYTLTGLRPGDLLPCKAEVLVMAAMPCAGLAACGACAVKGRQHWLLACEDGPVLEWERLE